MFKNHPEVNVGTKFDVIETFIVFDDGGRSFAVKDDCCLRVVERNEEDKVFVQIHFKKHLKPLNIRKM